ncbi:MAG TPA: macrolide ABC transporter ATP-binding protein [Phycisphaerales bacterium]|nr:macrolide ABC transporter ATP-binding protein [Phycisphaerales bacterium]HCD33792.1 macrolide ABC transporter ATP-binding protein [Phycisphaerales bacterium]|tara:strand:- start:1503 stop:2237 length:735 start_codon:yes stop_codon:yes gene_type:complete
MTQDYVAQLKGICKIYQRGKSELAVHALREMDMQVPRGQYLAIMGPSGSGKSTLMNILGCLDRPTSGQYLLEDKDVARMPDNDLSRVRRENLGFVFQAFNLIPQLTVMQNVQVPLFYQGMPRHQRLIDAQQAIDRVGLTDRMHHRPSELSGGQQQRVAIARALVNKPSLLFADEPTGNLDSKTGESILHLFDELHDQGMTLIMVTHDEGIADRCQRVIRLKDGYVDSDVAGGYAQRHCESSVVD